MGYWFLLFAVLILSSCGKDVRLDDKLHTEFGSEFSPFSVHNASVHKDVVGARVDDQDLLMGAPVLVSGKLLKHVNVFPGRRTLHIRWKASGRSFGEENLSAYALNLSSGRSYSVFLYGDEELKLKLVHDELIAPPQGKFRVRFANFYREHHGFNFVAERPSGVLAADVKYGEVSSFYELNVKSFSAIHYSNADTPLQRVRLESFKPVSKGVYTVWVYQSSSSIGSDGDRPQFVITAYP